MALLLAILLVTHWLSALTMIPAMIAIVKPRFVVGQPVQVEEEQPMMAEPSPQPTS